MNSGANIAVDPSSAFISAASQKDPLTYHQGVCNNTILIHITIFTLKPAHVDTIAFIYI